MFLFDHWKNVDISSLYFIESFVIARDPSKKLSYQYGYARHRVHSYLTVKNEWQYRISRRGYASFNLSKKFTLVNHRFIFGCSFIYIIAMEYR